MSEQEIERLASARMEVNRGSLTTQHWGNALAREMTGVRGEAAFADKYELPYDEIRKVRRGGDGGIDFVVHINGVRFTFDVKTRDGPREDMLVPHGKFEFKTTAEYFVLAQCIDKRVRFLAWEDPKLVLCMRVQKLKVPTHVRPLAELRPMRVLDNIMAQRDR